MKNLIKLNTDKGMALINPHHIVGVDTYNLKKKAKARVICLVGEYQVIETQEQIQYLVDNWVPAVGELYYFYEIPNGKLVTGKFLNDGFHNFNIKYGNCFQTEQDANINHVTNYFLKELIKPGEEAV